MEVYFGCGEDEGKREHLLGQRINKKIYSDAVNKIKKIWESVKIVRNIQTHWFYMLFKSIFS